MRNDLHLAGKWLRNFLTWKKRVVIRPVSVLINLKTERLTRSSIVQKARVSFVAYQKIPKISPSMYKPLQI